MFDRAGKIIVKSTLARNIILVGNSKIVVGCFTSRAFGPDTGKFQFYIYKEPVMKTHITLTTVITMITVWVLLLVSHSGAETTKGNPNSLLPVRKVVLYKHGVGYFERSGVVTGRQDIDLHFKADQMNDLLKSLTVIDLADGPVSSIVYDSTKTVEQLLSDYTFDLRKAQGLPQVLKQLQGSEVEATFGSEKITGIIVGVEERIITDKEAKIPTYLLNILDSDSRLRSINTDEILGVKFLDERLDRDIKRYMQTLFQQHRRDEKTVTIRPEGEGQRKLLVGYVTETPVWKATYRIVLGEKDKEKPFLQGWAIVDNVSEEDWNDVRLSLVSGLPISFVLNLYEPIFKSRPHVEIEEEMALAPTVPEEGMALERGKLAKKVAGVPAAMGAFGAGERSRMNLFLAPAAEATLVPADDAAIEAELAAEKMRDLQAQTVTREVGDLFEYRIEYPVTIARNRSALLPIVAAEVEGEAVALYNETTRAKNPLAAVRLKNTTGLTLEGGPLTVYQQGNYVGEALIKTVKADEQRYITYAVDLGLHVNTKYGSKSERVDRVVINRGTMRMHRAVIETKTYNLDNKDARDKVVVIEHPYHKDWKLLNKEKPIEITDNYQRFEVKTKGIELTKFDVEEERDNWEEVAVGNITPEQIEVFIQQKYLSDKTREQLEKIVSLKAEIVRIDRRINELQDEQKNIYEDQKRLREDLKSLGTTEQAKLLESKYLKKLEQQENQLDTINTELKNLQQERQQNQKQLDEMIETLTQDLKV